MGLANAAKRARNYDQTINQNQGGGNKKAGFPHTIGRDSWTSIYMGTDGPPGVRCCSLRNLQYTFNPNVKQSRPQGGSVTTAYWLRSFR
jgi:hypothetical protein